MSRFLTEMTLLMPTFSLLHAPRPVTRAASLPAERSSTDPYGSSGFGTTLKPRYIVGAGSLDQ